MYFFSLIFKHLYRVLFSFDNVFLCFVLFFLFSFWKQYNFILKSWGSGLLRQGIQSFRLCCWEGHAEEVALLHHLSRTPSSPSLGKVIPVSASPEKLLVVWSLRYIYIYGRVYHWLIVCTHDGESVLEHRWVARPESIKWSWICRHPSGHCERPGFLTPSCYWDSSKATFLPFSHWRAVSKLFSLNPVSFHVQMNNKSWGLFWKSSLLRIWRERWFTTACNWHVKKRTLH